MTNGTIDHLRFMALLTQQFPEVVATVDDCCQGLLHPEMGTLARATQAAIDAGDKETIRRHFAFVDEIFQDAAPDVENAIYVSYLENLRFEGRKAGPVDAAKLLSPRLQQARAELEAHWDNINRWTNRNRPTNT
ncbi:MAG: hypothetical protein WD971_13635 [Pirellulales bacterium]